MWCKRHCEEASRPTWQSRIRMYGLQLTRDPMVACPPASSLGMTVGRGLVNKRKKRFWPWLLFWLVLGLAILGLCWHAGRMGSMLLALPIAAVLSCK